MEKYLQVMKIYSLNEEVHTKCLDGSPFSELVATSIAC